MIANQAAKARYMFGGQFGVPLVVITGNGGGLRFGAQHSQSLENWAMAVPGLKVVAPSTPVDVLGLLAASIRDPDPVVFFAHKALMAVKGDVPDGEHVDELGTARIRRHGGDVTLLALAAMVPRALEAAELLAADGIEATVVDLRTLVPLDVATILEVSAASGVVFTIEENPRLLGWGAEVASLISEECFDALDGPVVRITAPQVPLPASGVLEDAAIPSVSRIHATVRDRCR
jgi:pyruvate dehydrogenase E1 component beta subunit